MMRMKVTIGSWRKVGKSFIRRPVMAMIFTTPSYKLPSFELHFNEYSTRSMQDSPRVGQVSIDR